MFPYDFKHHRAASIAEAVALGAALPDGRFLAGGQTLVQTMKLRLAAPTDLIDLDGVRELKGIALEGRRVIVGAMSRHAEVHNAAAVLETIPALAHLASEIGDRQVRNRGTIGGSLANNDPAADYPAAVLALDALIVTNERVIDADSFFVGLYETTLRPGELITSVQFPVPRRAGYVKFKNPASGFATVGVFVADFGSTVRVAVTGAGPTVFRLSQVEALLQESFSPQALDSVTVPADGLNSDLQADAAYRAHLIPVIARRAVASALGQQEPC
jgi:carbon-monoxide dehydrogenase medium subunit